MAQFDYNKVKDPRFFKENVLPAHSAHVIYRDREEYLLGNSSLRMPLAGVWKVSAAINQAAAPAV